MKKINNFANIEKLVYEDQGRHKNNIGPYRFVKIARYQGESYFYYDCFLATIVLLDINNVSKWDRIALNSLDLPFCISSNVNINNEPKFQRNEWESAVKNAQKIYKHLIYKISHTYFPPEITEDLQSCIDNIQEYFNLPQITYTYATPKNDIFLKMNNPEKPIVKVLTNSNETHVNQQISDNSVSHKNFTIVDNFIQNLQSPNLFHELNFGEKHTNKVYLLLEKIFHNFGILSKYKMEHVYEPVRKIDQYLVNHMKNIYLAQSFPMVNIEEETISILTKFNTYLTEEIDKYLEQCIDNQLSLIDSIHNKFTKVNQT